MEDNARGTEGNIEKEEVAHSAGSDPEDPSKVLPVERLLRDVRALKKLTATKEPPRVRGLKRYCRPYTSHATPVEQDSGLRS